MGKRKKPQKQVKYYGFASYGRGRKKVNGKLQPRSYISSGLRGPFAGKKMESKLRRDVKYKPKKFSYRTIGSMHYTYVPKGSEVEHRTPAIVVEFHYPLKLHEINEHVRGEEVDMYGQHPYERSYHYSRAVNFDPRRRRGMFKVIGAKGLHVCCSEYRKHSSWRATKQCKCERKFKEVQKEIVEAGEPVALLLDTLVEPVSVSTVCKKHEEANCYKCRRAEKPFKEVVRSKFKNTGQPVKDKSPKPWQKDKINKLKRAKKFVKPYKRK